MLSNSGHDVRLVIDEPGPNFVNITGGPLSYQYRASEILFHFGSVDKHGSEHSINGITFPAEVRTYGALDRGSRRAAESRFSVLNIAYRKRERPKFWKIIFSQSTLKHHRLRHHSQAGRLLNKNHHCLDWYAPYRITRLPSYKFAILTDLVMLWSNAKTRLCTGLRYLQLSGKKNTDNKHVILHQITLKKQ